VHTSKQSAARRGAGKLAAVAVAGSVLLALAGGASATAAEPEITGETSVTLAFSAPDTVRVSVITTNTSAVEAFGSASITGPDGRVYTFGPKSYDAGETWSYDKVLTGFTCADLGRVSGAAAGTDLPGDTAPDWTSGTVRSPDPRLTITGCDPAPPPPPVDPETPVDPAPVDPQTPAEPEAPVEPGVTAQPGVAAQSGAVAAPAVAPVANRLPASQTDGALVGTPWPTLGIAGVVGMLAVLLSAGLFQWARRN